MHIHEALFACVGDTDPAYHGSASGRIIADIAIFTVVLGMCIMCLLLLLIFWRKYEWFKRSAYSTCEYYYIVRMTNSYSSDTRFALQLQRREK